MDVALAACPCYDREQIRQALSLVLEPFGGLGWVREGMTIAVKANLVAGLAPERAATTHPALLCVLTEMLAARGAKVIIGDSPGGIYNALYVNRIYTAAGMRDAEKAGAELNRDFSVKDMENPEGKVLKTLSYTAWLDRADAIINFCKLKAHGMMGLSAAAKNMFGVIPGTTKPEYHFRFPDHDDFADMIVDLDEFFKPTLCLCDAVLGMEGNGPTSGTPRQLGFLAASLSPHKLDQVCCGILGMAEDDIPTIRAAKRRGLIPVSASDLAVSGNPADFTITDFRHEAVPHSLLFAGDGQGKGMKLFSAFAGSVLHTEPRVKEKECVACGVCRNICPAGAIVIEKKKVTIDREKCIRCFCCQEFCPKGALRVHRSPLARLLRHI